MASGRKVLVVGSGGREHALSVKLLESPSVREVVVVPGNAGTERTPTHVGDKVLRNAAGDVLALAQSERADLVVVGPEAPLCDGLVDTLTEAGVVAYGPSREAARLEGSKAFMKSFAERHGLKTALHVEVRDAARLRAAIERFTEPPVVKADGLCAGKGVVVAETHDEAFEAASAMLSGGRFGAAGSVVVLEQRLRGAEASLHAICDGERALMLPAAQDHKRIGDGDTGPNTGGMGTYAPAPLVTAALLERIQRDVFERTLAGMAAEGHPFRGTLFAGLMIDPAGEPYLLEFNVRFGDPETQVLMNVINGDLAEALDSAARGRVDTGVVAASGEHAVCVVMAAAGYPDTPRTGDVITGIDRAEQVPGARVYHAGTLATPSGIVTTGGRVLGVTGRASTLQEARDRAYEAAAAIEFAGRQVRRDIAQRAFVSSS